MNAIGYIRISVKDQSQYSLEYQERKINEYCTAHGLQLLSTFKDDGESSYTFDRPNWKMLEQFIRKNKSVEYLLIFDHDRLSRNLAEALMKIKELQDKFGIKVLATTDSFDTDFSDPTTFMMRAFKYMMAESELHRIRQRTRNGYVEASLKGLYVNKAPYGYHNQRNDAGQPTLTIDEEKATIVRLIFQEYNRGSNIEEIKETLKPYQYKQKGNSAIQRILTNPVYAGMVRVPAHSGKPEQIKKAIHPAIVSEIAYWQAQNRLNGNLRTGQHSREEVPLKGVLRCHCSQMLSAGNSKGKMGKYYWYYVCSHHRKHLSAIKLERQLNEVLDVLSFSDERITYFSEKLSEEITRFLSVRSELTAKTTKALRQIQDKIMSAEERYLLEEGAMSKKTYDKVMSGLKSQAMELEKRLLELSGDHNIYWKRLGELLPKLHDLRGTYEGLDIYRKQQFLNMVFDNSLTHDGGVYRTQYIHPMFAHNIMELKEKGLLVVEQPEGDLGDNPVRTAYGSPIELFTGLFNVLAA